MAQLYFFGKLCHTVHKNYTGVMDMKGKKKFTAFLLLMLCTVMLCGVSVNAGFRRMSNGKYRYYTSKTKYIKGKSNGKAYQRWTFKTIGKKGKRYTYCFDENGYMLTGWQNLTTKSSGGKYYWYYFDKNGRMFKNRTKNGHYLQKNGQMLTNGWMNGTYYGEDGAAIAGYRQDVNNGFKTTKKGTKYMQADGTYAAKKWLCIKDSEGKYYWYYFYSSGYMAKNTWVGNSFVDANGRLIGRR